MPDRPSSQLGSISPLDDRERGLWDLVIPQARSHRRLVGHDVGRLGPDTREAEQVSDRRRDRDGAVSRDGDHGIDLVAAGSLATCSSR